MIFLGASSLLLLILEADLSVPFLSGVFKDYAGVLMLFDVDIFLSIIIGSGSEQHSTKEGTANVAATLVTDMLIFLLMDSSSKM